MSGKTHPIYIDEGQKRTVKAKAAELDTSMKEVVQRLTTHGLELGLHKLEEDAEVTEVIETLEEEQIDSLNPVDVEQELEAES